MIGEDDMNMVYRPVIKSVPVSYNLKTKLLKRLWPKDNFDTPIEIDVTWVGYFQGLIDAGYSEAELIVDALRVHEKIQFTLES
jgi:hypothetical protein